MGDVCVMPTGKVDSKALLEAIKDNDFSELLVVGIDETGRLYVAGTTDRLEELNMLLDLAKAYVLDQVCATIPGVVDD